MSIISERKTFMDSPPRSYFPRSDFLLVCVTLVSASISTGVPAYANLLITPTFDTTITSDANAAAIEAALNQVISTYETLITNPINVTIKFQELSTGLGQSNTTLYKLSYSTFSNALAAGATSADDATAIALNPVGAINPVTGSANINIKTANIRALGIAGSFPPIGGFDGTIGLNTHITDIGSPGTSGLYDLKATASHEIDEVLGLGSDLGNPTVPFFNDPAPEDIFRYSSSGVRSFTQATATAYFSINGTTDLAQFNNQSNGGDYGDWQSTPRPSGVPPQVQDAFATPNAHPVLGVELRALDVIGYNLVSVPEPATLLLSGSILLALGGLAQRRARKNKSPR